MSSENKYTLKPSLSEKFKGIIWKIETDDIRPVVAIETRDTESHTTAISAFDFSAGKCLFRQTVVEDSWNWGLDRVTNGLIFLHGYVAEKNPEHKGIIALNKSGEIEWQLFNKTLYTVAEEGLVAYNPAMHPRFLELISPQTGLVLKPSIKDYVPVQRDIIVPDVPADISLHKHLLPSGITGPLFYAAFNGKKCYSFHVQEGTNFLQKLVIYQDDTLLLDEILAHSIQKLNPEAFFIQHNHLFCIQDNKQKFVSYLL